jgi:serine/threonine protein kinase
MSSNNGQNNAPGQERPSAAQDAATMIEPTRAAGDPLVGTTIGGRYHVERVLGMGGIGKVYFARDKPELISRPVVIKVLREESLKSPWIINKFRHEIEALASIDDPCVTGILDAGELTDGSPYLVMQYVDGVTLRSLIDPVKDRGMEIESAANIIRQVCRALASAHEKGIYHRDLKPENIMVRHPGTPKEHAKIIDFGIAKVTNSVAAPTTGGAEKIVGTIAYMSPEQLGAEPVTASSDIYSLGIIAYEMLTGRRPFNFETIYELPKMHAAGVQVAPKSLRPALTEHAQAIILKALAYEPQDRYARVADFGDNLASALTATDLNAGSRNEDKIETVRKPDPAPPRKAGRGRVLIPVIALSLAAIGVLAWLILRPKVETKASNDQAASSAPAPAAAPSRTMNYYMVVQRYRNGERYKEPYTLPGEINFESDDRVQIFFTSPETGYFYLINEGPKVNGAAPNLIVLFPDKDRPAALPANQRIRIPDPTDDQEWIQFDQAEGAEKLWMIWAARPVAELEAVKKWANPKDAGEVGDAEEDKKVREFLSQYSSASSPVPKQSEEGDRTTVSGKGDILVYPVKLQHH